MPTLGSPSLRAARAFAAVQFDDGHGVPSDRLDWLVADFADYCSHVGGKTRLAFRFGILALQLLPLFFIGVPLPMSWLSLRLRRRYLERLEQSKMSFLVIALKAPLTLCYFEHPDALAHTGYDGKALVEGDDPERALRAPSKAGVVKLPVARVS